MNIRNQPPPGQPDGERQRIQRPRIYATQGIAMNELPTMTDFLTPGVSLSPSSPASVRPVEHAAAAPVAYRNSGIHFPKKRGEISLPTSQNFAAETPLDFS
jgi:hypothetical protein